MIFCIFCENFIIFVSPAKKLVFQPKKHNFGLKVAKVGGKQTKSIFSLRNKKVGKF